MIWFDLIWFDLIWFVCFDMIWPDTCKVPGLQFEHFSGSVSKYPIKQTIGDLFGLYFLLLCLFAYCTATLSLWVMSRRALLVMTWSWIANIAFVSDFIQATSNENFQMTKTSTKNLECFLFNGIFFITTMFSAIFSVLIYEVWVGPQK